MAVEIKTINLSRMRQAEDFAFHSLAIAEMRTCKEPSFTDMLTAYEKAFEAFDKELKNSGGKDPLTKDVMEADAATDRCYVGMTMSVRALLYHYDATIVELARRMLIIIERYGNPTNLAYLQAYGIIDNLLQDLRAFDTEEIGATEEDSEEEEEERPGGLALDTHNLASLGVDGWVDHLKQCRDRFMEIFARRNAQQATVESGTTTASRKEADRAYRSAVKRINALIEVNGDSAFNAVVANLNNLIDRQKGIQTARNTRNASKNNSPGEGEERPGGL